jgi:hypothetical protein
MSDILATNQEQKLERLKAIPRRLPDAIVQSKVTFVPGRKRALTGREAAELQEKEQARERRRAQIAAEKQAKNDARQDEAAAVRSQLLDAVAAEYVASQDTESHKIINISDSDSDEFVDTDVLIAQSQARTSSIQPKTLVDDIIQQDESPDSDEFVDIDVLIAQSQARSQAPIQPTTSSSRPIRVCKPTAKQASQNRRAIEKEDKRLARLTRKPKTVDTTQLDDFELPFRSSQ